MYPRLILGKLLSIKFPSCVFVDLTDYVGVVMLSI